ncbi:hypothetical protein LV84_01176 [Algoriphagus ratkowskyi]|uniref:Uncharacterized protein n=1 Tax=Algoriphagus ratkowskyi TaxID=57028 RepID=A0A2W7RKY5_9BACT|nr:hypothetical protein LV84_01176 [Algoriphagus ratkowskyi]
MILQISDGSAKMIFCRYTRFSTNNETKVFPALVNTNIEAASVTCLLSSVQVSKENIVSDLIADNHDLLIPDLISETRSPLKFGGSLSYLES